ncbi:MAG TPA: NADH-quinone oxidoreductase subunit N [Actinomycetota bacterium]|nr:NADH-quinone oxidoreductase subunit N [Actinomycetota bacterium]
MSGAENLNILLPEVVLVGTALLLLVLDGLRPESRGAHFAFVTIVALGVAGWLSWTQWDQDAVSGLGGMVVADRFGVFVRWIILLAAGLATLTAHGHLKPRGLDRAEFYALVLLSTSGMTMLSVASDLVMVFLSIELLSLALYVLAGFDRSRLEAQEAAMKYFLLGAFASAFLLYGIAYVFGASGTTNLLRLNGIVASSGIEDFRLMGVAVGLLAVGFGFKAAMVPFHMWTPDAYQGAPTPVTAFMAGGTKAAAFAALIRTLLGAMEGLRWDWRPPLIALALLTIIFASIVAVAQTDLKRMLAYSSIAHAGFIAIGIVAASRTGIAAVLLYLLVYTAMTIGAFACIMLFRDGGGERTHLAQLAGLGSRRPGAAALFALFLFSLAGIPPTGGFFAKFHVFLAAVKAGYAWLAVVAVVASVVAAFFYVRVAVVMFMQDPADDDEQTGLDRSRGLRAALAICVAIVLATGVKPDVFLNVAERAVRFAATTPAADQPLQGPRVAP